MRYSISLKSLLLSSGLLFLPSILNAQQLAFPTRDAIDARIIEEIRGGTAKFGRNGIIDHPNDVGGWPELKSLPAPVDSDHDGMPDEWETKNGLSPDDPTDGAKTGKNGYTNVENYINGLVDDEPVSNETVIQNKKSTSKRFLVTSSYSSKIITMIPEKSNIKMDIFDMTGRHVTTLIDRVKEAGKHSIDTSDLMYGTGFFIVRLTIADMSITDKIFIRGKM